MVLPTESPALGKIRRKGVCFWFWPLISCMCVVVDEVVIAVFKQRRGFISMYVWKNKCESRDFQTIRIAHISFSVSLRLAYPRGQHWGIALATVEPHGGGREVPQNSGAVIIRRRERCWIHRTTQIYYVPRLQIGKVKLGKPLTPWAKPHLCCAASRNDISVLGMGKTRPRERRQICLRP